MGESSKIAPGPVQYLTESAMPITTYRFKWVVSEFKNISLKEKRACPFFNDLPNEYTFDVIENKLRAKRNTDSEFCFYLTSSSNEYCHVECDLQVKSQTGEILHWHISMCKFDATRTRDKHLVFDLKSVAMKDRILNSLEDTLIFDVSLKKIEEVKIERAYDHVAESSQKLREDLRDLCQSTETADVALFVGEEKILAHKTILCARSPVFKSMLSHPMNEKGENIITIDGVTHSDLQIFLQFLYTGVLLDENMDAYRMYKIADEYQLMDLRKICGDLLLSKLTVSNSWPLLDLAHHHADEDLKKKVLGFIAHNAPSFVSADDWKSFFAKKVQLAMDTLWYGGRGDNNASKKRKIQED